MTNRPRFNIFSISFNISYPFLSLLLLTNYHSHFSLFLSTTATLSPSLSLSLSFYTFPHSPSPPFSIPNPSHPLSPPFSFPKPFLLSLSLFNLFVSNLHHSAVPISFSLTSIHVLVSYSCYSRLGVSNLHPYKFHNSSNVNVALVAPPIVCRCEMFINSFCLTRTSFSRWFFLNLG